MHAAIKSKSKADTIANGGTWDGANTWQELVQEDPENWEWLTNRLSECILPDKCPGSRVLFRPLPRQDSPRPWLKHIKISL